MKRVYISILFLCLGITHLYANADIAFEAQDTAQVNLLNRQGFQIHLNYTFPKPKAQRRGVS